MGMLGAANLGQEKTLRRSFSTAQGGFNPIGSV